jgi:hypothetical protein
MLYKTGISIRQLFTIFDNKPVRGLREYAVAVIAAKTKAKTQLYS